MEILSLVVSVIFIILLFSILASSVQEILSNWLSLRGAILMRAIHNLFEGPEMKILYVSWVQSSDFGFFLLKQSSQNIFGRFFDNLAKQVRLILGVEIPVPKAIDKNRKDRLELPPSYISSDAFLLMLENINLEDSFITGSNGKTTTTMWIHHILKNGGKKAELAGNVGKSLARLVIDDEAEIYVIELSSFQLDDMYAFQTRHCCIDQYYS